MVRLWGSRPSNSTSRKLSRKCSQSVNYRAVSCSSSGKPHSRTTGSAEQTPPSCAAPAAGTPGVSARVLVATACCAPASKPVTEQHGWRDFKCLWDPWSKRSPWQDLNESVISFSRAMSGRLSIPQDRHQQGVSQRSLFIYLFFSRSHLEIIRYSQPLSSEGSPSRTVSKGLRGP